jgi:peptidyl-prolyl cis-trans isomerase SurA
MRAFASIALLSGLLLVPSLGQGQVGLDPGSAEPGSDALVDRVAAVVGDSIVLYSQIMEQIGRFQAQGMEVPENDPQAMARLEREVLDDMVDQLVLLQAAARDTLVAVSDDQVDQTFAEAWEDQIRRFGGSEDQLREAVEQMGMSMSQYRSSMRQEIRQSLLLQRFMQDQRRQARPVIVEESEIREFFERESQRFGERPATLTFRQVFLQPQASDSARAAAREQAEEILERLGDGESFSDLASRFSDDPGSRQQGGELGWYRRGDGLVEEFEDAAFGLREGQTSGIVDTPFGSHIIRVERVRGAERKLHHILVAAEPTSADEERARERAREVAEMVRGGSSLREFEAEAARFGLPDSVTVPRDQLNQFPQALASALQGASEGEVVGPVEFPLGQGMNVFAIVRMDEIRDAGRYSFEDVREQIRANLQEQKLEDRLVARLRDRTYLDIRL